MKILWITNSVYPYRQKVFEWIRTEHDLKLITLGKEFSSGGVTHNSQYKKFKYRLRIPFRVLFELRKYDYIVVSGWDSIGYISVTLLARILKIPNSLLFESTLDSRIHKTGLVAHLRTLVFQLASTVITLSKLSHEAAIQYCRDTEKIVSSRNWFDPENFTFTTPSIDEEGYVFIYLGRLIPQKGISRMIKAFYDVADEKDQLLILGEGPEKDNVSQLCLDNRVIFLGSVHHNRLHHYLSKSQALIFPTFNDVYGFPCLEALSCGLGVVVSRNAGIWKDIYQLPGVIVFDDDLTGALQEMKATKKKRQFVDLSEFHLSNVLQTINIAHEKSRVLFHRK